MDKLEGAKPCLVSSSRRRDDSLMLVVGDIYIGMTTLITGVEYEINSTASRRGEGCSTTVDEVV